MKTISAEIRRVYTDCGELVYTFEHKIIKNINLRVKHNGKICVSAPQNVPRETVDAFVISKSDYIYNALDNFKQYDIPVSDMKYVSGENVTFLGKNMRINVVKDTTEYVSCDGVYVYIHVKDSDNYTRKKNLIKKWLDEQCYLIFNEIMKDVYKRFVPYDISFPQLKLRSMVSRWGSCLVDKGVITLNKRLIEAPKNCIEYVIYHEFCHFVHPNHSKQFYTLLQVMLPDWKKSKKLLEDTIGR